MKLDDLLGASIIVALTFIERDGSERLEAYAGKVIRVEADTDEFHSVDDGSNSEVVIVECLDGETRSFPFDPDAVGPAEPGFYELIDGTTISDPDFEMFWRITAPTEH